MRKALGYKDDVAFKTEHHANTMAELRKEYGRREEAPESSRRRVWGAPEGSQTARGHTKRGKGNKQTFEEALAPNPNPTRTVWPDQCFGGGAHGSGLEYTVPKGTKPLAEAVREP